MNSEFLFIIKPQSTNRRITIISFSTKYGLPLHSFSVILEIEIAISPQMKGELMDQIKIGKFIAEMRKEQDLTQKDLADALGISNKTISKWECGNGMPDYSIMENLCDVLKINVNELISGERLPSADYTKKAEENIMSLIQESSKMKQTSKLEFIISIIAMIGLIGGLLLMIFSFGGMAAFSNFLDVPILTIVLIITLSILALSGLLSDFCKAFCYVTKKECVTSIQDLKKALRATKTAVLAVNIAGILCTIVSVIIVLDVTTPDTFSEHFPMWFAVALLSVCYGLIFSLLLLPVIVRLKNLFEEHE